VEAKVPSKAATSLDTVLVDSVLVQVGLSDRWNEFDADQLTREATAVFDRLVARFPMDPDALEAQARMELLVGRTDKARQNWEKCLSIDPQYAYAKHGLGLIAAKNTQLAEAEMHFREALAGLSDHAETVQELSDVLMKAGKLQEAVAVLKDYVTRHDDATEFWVRLGQAHVAQQDWTGAKSAYEKALRLNPDIPKAQSGLANALLRLGQREEAKRLLELQKSAPQRTNSPPSTILENELRDIASRYYFAARVYAAHHDHLSALALLERAKLYDPLLRTVRESAIEMLLHVNQIDRAQESARELAQLAPEVPTYHYTLGVIAGRRGDASTAIAAFQQVIRLAPSDPKAFLALANLFLAQKERQSEAVELARKAVQLQPSAISYAILGSSLAATGNLEESAQALRSAIGFDPESPELKRRLQQLEQALREKKP
jgi:tetratricopeptide (TPR) repeat protein